MSLATIAVDFEAFAEEALADLEQEGVLLAEKIAGDLETGFESLVGKLGQAAANLVAKLMSDDSLSGLEKANLATAQLVDQAAQTGIELAAHDATALIKSGYQAVMDALKTS